MITGPGSPSVLSNMMVSIERHVDWIAGCVAYLRSRGLTASEATQAAGRVGATQNVWPTDACRWRTHMGFNIPGKPQVFMPHGGGGPIGTLVMTSRRMAAEGCVDRAVCAMAASGLDTMSQQTRFAFRSFHLLPGLSRPSVVALCRCRWRNSRPLKIRAGFIQGGSPGRPVELTMTVCHALSWMNRSIFR
jgi:hypothetical protein